MTYRKKDWHGGSPKTATTHASASTKNTTPPTTIKTDESENCSLAPEKRSSLEPPKAMPSLSGENLSTSQAKKALTARSSATKARGDHPSLSDRLTPLLIARGLVNGTTPTSVRKQCGAVIPATASKRPDGSDVGTPKAASSFLKEPHP